MEVRRIGPDGGFLREMKAIQTRIRSQETRPAGNIVIRETITTTDPSTGVSAVFGQLPSGDFGFQPFIGDIIPPPVASMPVATSQPGYITVAWDGLFVNNEAQPRDFEHLNVMAHKIVNGATTLTVEAGVVRLPFETLIVGTDLLTIGETWQFSFESEDYNGNISARSVRTASITVQSAVTDAGINQALANVNNQVISAQSAAASAQTAANNAQTSANNAAQAASDAAGIAASKSKVLIQSAAPAAADQNSNVLWIDTTNGLNAPKRWSGSAWVTVTDKAATDAASAAAAAQTKADQAFNNAASAATAAGNAQTTADGKNRVWYQGTAPAGTGNKLGDIWFDTSNGNKPNAWNGSAWVSAQDASISAAQNTANSALTSANGKNTTYYQNAQPSSGTYLKGDTWFDTANGYKLYTYTGSVWQATQDSQTALNTANSKTKTFTQSTAPTATTTGDIWIDTANGNVIKIWNGSAWTAYQDAAIAAAQTAANNAQTSANGKNKIYYQGTQPSGGTYISGDTWFDTSNGNKIYVYNGSTWAVSQDTAIGTAQSTANTANSTANTALTTANSKTKTYFQSTSPAVTGNTSGDIWFDTGNGNKTYVWNGSAWTLAQDTAIAAAQTSANGKNRIYYQTTQPSGGTYIAGDTWFDTSNGNKIYVYSGSAWVNAQDASIATAQTAANNAQTAANTAQTTANAKTTTFTQSAAPSAAGRTTGDIWFDTSNGNKAMVWSGSAWVSAQDTAISTAQTTANNALTSANGKNKVYYQNTQPSGGTYILGDTWFDTGNGYKIYVYNGSAWIASQDTSIAAAQTTANTANTTANSKTKTFIQSTAPTATTVGDIWIDTANGNVIKVWEGSAWINRADAAIAAAQSAANTAQTTANGKNTVVSAASAPATAGRIAGDIWFDTSNGNKPMVFSGSAWVSAQDASISTAQNTANSKTKTFIQGTAPTSSTVGDIWIDTANGNVIKTWEGSSWVNRADAAIAAAQAAATSAQTSANGKNTNISAATAPATAGHIVGDLWFDTSNGNKPMYFNGTTWVSAQDASIATAQTAANTAQTTANGKNTATYSSSAASGSGTRVGDIWFQTNASNIIIGQWQWNGSAWIQQTIDNAVIANLDAGKINAGFVNAARIQAGTITSTMIATDTITAGNVAAGAITASELAAGSVQANHLTTNSVSASAMVANTITAGQIAGGTITAAQIATDTITAGNIAAGAITASELAAGSVQAQHLTVNSVSATAIVSDSITAAQIASDAITANELAANSITAAKGQISDLAITTAKIQDGQITTAKIANLAVTNAQIADATIASAKIAQLDAGKITTGTLDANRIGANTITADKVVIGDTENWVVDPYMTGLGKINGATYLTAANTSVSANAPYPSVAYLNSRDNLESPRQFRPATGGDQFYVEAWVRADANAKQSIYLGLWSQSADGTPTWTTTGGTGTATVAAGQAGWVKLSATLTVPASISGKPITVASAWIQINGNIAADITGWYITGWTMRRKNTGNLIVDGAIQAGSAIIGTGAIGTAQIGNLAVGTAQIADTAITTAKIANLAVTNAQIADATIASAKIAQLDAGKITTGTLDANRIGADTITAFHIGTDAITANELAANSITAAKGQIADLAITTAKIQDSQITTAKIANLAVNTAQIADAAINNAKIANLDAAKITTGTLDANRIGAYSISATKLQIGDFENLATIDELNGITISTNGQTQIVNGYNTKVNDADAFFMFRERTGPVPFKPGDKLRVTFTIKAAAATIVTPTVWVYDTGGANTAWTSASQNVGTTDTLISVVISIGTPTNPSKEWVVGLGGSTGKGFAVKNVVVRRMNGGELLVDGTITAGSAIIANGAIGTAQIANLAVDTAQIKDTAITNAKIADATIASAKIAQLDAGKITTGYLDAARLQAGTITAASGIIGSLDASVITAGTLSAARIGSKSITVDKLVVSSSDNLIVEANFNNNGSSWGPLTANTTINATAGRGGLAALHVTGTTATQTVNNLVNRVTVGAEDRFRGSFYMKCAAAAPSGAVTLNINAYVSGTSAIPVVVATSQAITAVNQYVLVEGYSPVLPAGTIAAEFFITAACPSATGTIDIDYVAMTRAADGHLVVDGAIDGKTITGATLQTAKTGARIVLDNSGLKGWDATGNQYLTANSSGLNVTGTLGATGDGYDYNLPLNNGQPATQPVSVSIGGAAGFVGLGNGGQWPPPSPLTYGKSLPGIAYRPTTKAMYDLASITARDGQTITLQRGTTQAEFDAWANETYVDPSGATLLKNTGKPYIPTMFTVDKDGTNFSKYVNADEFRIGGKSMSSGEVQTWNSSGTVANNAIPVINLGGFTYDANDSTSSELGNFTDNTITIRTTGVYDIHVDYGQTGGATGPRNFIEINASNQDRLLARSTFGVNEDSVSVTASGVVLPAGTVIKIQALQDSGAARPYVARVRLKRTAAPMPTLGWGAGSQTIAGNLTVSGDTSIKHRRAEFSNGGFGVAANSVWDIGTQTVNTAATATLNNDFCQAGPYSGSIGFTKSGYYSVMAMVSPQADPGRAWLRAVRGSDGRYLGQVSNNLAFENTLTLVPFYFAAGDYVRFQYLAVNAHNIMSWVTVTQAY